MFSNWSSSSFPSIQTMKIMVAILAVLMESKLLLSSECCWTNAHKHTRFTLILKSYTISYEEKNRVSRRDNCWLINPLDWISWLLRGTGATTLHRQSLLLCNSSNFLSKIALNHFTLHHYNNCCILSVRSYQLTAVCSGGKNPTTKETSWNKMRNQTKEHQLRCNNSTVLFVYELPPGTKDWWWSLFGTTALF